MESGKTFGAYELKVDRTFDETNDSMWISKRIWTIEETLLRIDGNLVFLHFIRRRSDWIVKNTHEKTARLQIGLRRNVTTTATRHQHDTSKHDGKRPVGGSRRQFGTIHRRSKRIVKSSRERQRVYLQLRLQRPFDAETENFGDLTSKKNI